MYHSTLFSIFFIHVLFKRAVFPTPLFIQVDHLLSCILPSRSGSALNPTEAAYYLVLSFYHLPRLSKCIASSDYFLLRLNHLVPGFLSKLPHPAAGQTSRSSSSPWSPEAITLSI
ncbi:hypothetical protein ATANTOWER_031245 [Ataeniobius toweri]|uniref:Secreted protein n=1 Tax=Ataeniobius toweri TaxID=208326 RepID=A0ABU7CD39_9TELE|nr:hypothetical protein [Ataeniobius toweri]